jgi:hypothetical protein
MRKQTGFKFKVEMRCTITDPVERRHRLAQVYAFFERGMIWKQRDTSIEESGTFDKSPLGRPSENGMEHGGKP